jgi:hypothetical protein
VDAYANIPNLRELQEAALRSVAALTVPNRAKAPESYRRARDSLTRAVSCGAASAVPLPRAPSQVRVAAGSCAVRDCAPAPPWPTKSVDTVIQQQLALFGSGGFSTPTAYAGSHSLEELTLKSVSCVSRLVPRPEESLDASHVDFPPIWSPFARGQAEA